MRTYHELFTEEYFAIAAESTRTNCMKELSSLYALSKLKLHSKALLALPIAITSIR